MITITKNDLSVLLPMHLMLDRKGRILSAGGTIRRLFDEGQTLCETFTVLNLAPGETLPDRLAHAARTHERICLQQLAEPRLRLRGQAVMARGAILLHLSFGMGLVEAVRTFDLTESDFTPTDLAMEFLFLHEANRAIMGELSRFTQRLDEARRTAQQQALTDALTGLSNRRGAELALEAALSPTGSAISAPFAIGQIDLDHFKSVNDSLGHAAGDTVLSHVAEILRAQTREGDTVARMGGDEFLILLAGEFSDDTLRRLGERIITCIEKPIVTQFGTCRISASIGFARGGPEHMSGDALLTLTDAALYASKRSGRGRVTIVSPQGTADAAP